MLRNKDFSKYHVGGFRVCRTAYCLIRGLHSSTLDSYNKEARALLSSLVSPSGIVSISARCHGGTGAKRPSPALYDAARFVR